MKSRGRRKGNCSKIMLWRMAMYLAHFKGHGRGENWEAYGRGGGGSAAWVYERELEKAEGRHTQ
jgi:hypothetical protein